MNSRLSRELIVGLLFTNDDLSTDINVSDTYDHLICIKVEATNTLMMARVCIKERSSDGYEVVSNQIHLYRNIQELLSIKGKIIQELVEIEAI